MKSWYGPTADGFSVGGGGFCFTGFGFSVAGGASFEKKLIHISFSHSYALGHQFM